MKKLLMISAAVTFALCLPACNSPAFQEATNFMFAEPINSQQRNYSTADYLASQIKSFINPANDIIKMEPLVDVDQPALRAAIARDIPAQVGERLVQLGYQIDNSAVTGPADRITTDAGARAAFVVSGNYRRNRASLDVDLRVTELATGRVITAYQYNTPLSKDLNRMSTPKPAIVRSAPPQNVTPPHNY